MAFNPVMSRSMEVRVSSSGFDAVLGKLAAMRGSLGAIPKAAALAGVALGALAVGGMAVATKAAADFETAMVEVEKVTSAAVAAELNDEIREMARTMPVAHEELATIAATAGRLGIQGTENIRTFTEHVAKMAEATDLTAQEAADSFARMQKLMDLSVDDTERLGSAINELANNMGASSAEIVNAATRSAGVLNQMGLTSQQILALNGAMNEVSATSRIAGTQLRRFGQELTDPNKIADLAGALDMTVEEFRRLRDNSPIELMKKMAEAQREGKDTAEALNGVLGNTSRQTLAKLAQNWSSVENATTLANGQFENATSLQREFDAVTETFNAQLNILKNNFVDNGIAIGSVLLPHLTNLLKEVNSLMQSGNGLSGVLRTNESRILSLGKTIRGFVSNTVSVLLLAWRENESQARSTFTAIQTLIQQVLSFILGTLIRPTLDKINALWNRHGDEILASAMETFSFLQTQFEGFVAMVQRLWDAWGEDILTIARITFTAISAVIGAVLDTVLTTIRVVLALIRGDWNEAWNAIGGLLERILGGLLDFVITWGDDLLLAFVSLIGKVAAFVAKRGAELIWDAFNFVLDGIVSLFEGFYNWLIGGSFIQDMFGEIAGYIRTTAKTLLQNATREAVDTVIGVFEDLRRTLIGNSIIPDMNSAIVRNFEDMTDQVGSRVASLSSEAVREFNRLQNASTSTSEAVASTTNKISKEVQDAIKKWNRLQNTIKDAKEPDEEDGDGSDDKPNNEFQPGEFRDPFIEGMRPEFRDLADRFMQISDHMAREVTDFIKDEEVRSFESVSDVREELLSDFLMVAGNTTREQAPVKRLFTEMEAGKEALSRISEKGFEIFKDIESMQTGGVVTKGGLFELHAGEKVVPTEMASGGGTTVNLRDVIINAEDPGDGAQQFLRELRSAGVR